MGVRDRIRTFLRLFFLFAVLVTIALVSALTTIRLTIRGHQETMPDLVSMPLETAQRVTSGLGLELKIEDKLFTPQVPANHIVSQMPPPGTQIKVGQHVHVLVSLGPPRVAVPNLLGGSIRAARITAVQRGLTVGDVAAVHWPGSEADQVVAQDPAPSSGEVHSPAVNFLVSLGDTPAAFLCPNFVGRQIADVRRVLERAGFKPGETVLIPTDAAAKGAILAQTPPPGSRIGPDTAFTFQVADQAAPGR